MAADEPVPLWDCWWYGVWPMGQARWLCVLRGVSAGRAQRWYVAACRDRDPLCRGICITPSGVGPPEGEGACNFRPVPGSSGRHAREVVWPAGAMESFPRKALREA